VLHSPDIGSRSPLAVDGAERPTIVDPETAARQLQDHTRNETRRARTDILIEPLVDTLIVQHLRESGEYARLRSRAEAKRSYLAATDMYPPELGDADVTPEELTAWFCSRSGQAPGHDAATEARRLHFDDTLAFLRALVGEYLYAGQT
jgi:hypothetical protein